MLSFFSSVVDCTGANPCLNGGTCDTDACTCAAGFYGALCDIGIIVTYIKGHLTLKHNFTYAGSFNTLLPIYLHHSHTKVYERRKKARTTYSFPARH